LERDRYVYEIRGGVKLEGEYRVKGAKNSALPVLAAALCRGGCHEIHGCPRIGDALALVEILEALGAVCRWEGDCLEIDSRSLCRTEVPRRLMSCLRSSVFLLGSLLARTGEAVIYRPGGCRIGSRPIDIHTAGLVQLGFTVEEEEEKVTCRGRCRGGRIRLSFPSVGATENLMMAALSGDQLTIIENCAMEPEIVDLQGFLRTCGFQVDGAGSPVIRVLGRDAHPGGQGRSDSMYFIMEDRIEAATYLMAAAGCGGECLLRGIRGEYLEEVLAVLRRMGAVLRTYGDLIEVKGPEKLVSPGEIITAPYPGFPTDCQPQLLSLAAAAEGVTIIREGIFENRFTHKKELVKMGANIETCGKNAIIEGIDVLRGNRVQALDLRGGAALVLAGLMAEGTTTVTDIDHIERGYQEFPEGLRQLGGRIGKRKEKQTEKESQPADQAADSDFAGWRPGGISAFSCI